MPRLTPPPSVRRWPSLIAKPRHVRVLVLVVAGWVLLRIAGGPAEAAPASSGPGLPPDLPLARDAGPGAFGGWELLRGSILVAAVLAIAFVVVLRTRFRSTAVPPSGGPRGLWARWVAPALPNRPLRVVQSSRLTARASVHVLRWGDEEWLVGCSEHGMSVLGQRTPRAAADAAPEAAAVADPDVDGAPERARASRIVAGEPR